VAVKAAGAEAVVVGAGDGWAVVVPW